MMVRSQMLGLGEHLARHMQPHNIPSATDEQLHVSLLFFLLNQLLAAISIPAAAHITALSRSHLVTFGMMPELSLRLNTAWSKM